MNFYLAAITLGLMGSFHCIGMCGPIALSIPVHKLSGKNKTIGILIYNSGRIFTYTLLGILFGLLGEGFALFGYQQSLSITLGLLIIVTVIFGKKYKPTNRLSQLIFSYTNKLKLVFKSLFNKENRSSLFFIGFLNGLLPCGLIYIAIAGAIATCNYIDGMFFMFLFGLGTLPAMISISLISNKISISNRNKIRKVIPVFVASMGILLILRGLNLGIPYLSPSADSSGTIEHTCCNK